MRLPSYVPALVTALLAAGGSVGAAVLAVDAVERRSHTEVSDVLEVTGYGWVEVTVDGLQVTLAGTAPDEATRFRALTAAGTVVDASRVIDTMGVAQSEVIAPRFSVEALRNDGGISLIGLIPTEIDRDAVIGTVEQIAGDLPVTDLLETADHPAPPGWGAALDYGLDALSRLPRSKISIDAERVRIDAIGDSDEQRRTLEAELARAAPDGLVASIEISAPRPVVTPFTLRFIVGADGARFDACSADTEEARDQILAAARAAGLAEKGSCTLGLGAPSPSWGDAAATAIAALAKLDGGSITFSDADVSLVALETTSQSEFDRVVGELETDLPDVFSLHAVLPEPPAAETQQNGPPMFTATRGSEGKVELRGRIGDERSKAAAESFARARFGSETVYGAMRTVEGLPEGWSVRVLAALDALSLVADGSVRVQPDLVAVSGTTGVQDASAEISRILSEKLGEGQEFEIDVSYQRKLDPLLNLPTPEECVARINQILAIQKIVFEPGSAEIGEGSLQTVEDIAEAMTDCEDVPMEIGGHTDSQGREVMNLELSQARATALLDALMAERVLTSNLTAVGYGEAQPIADNDSEDGREANRRIEFTLLSDSEAEEADAVADARQTSDTEAEADGADGEDTGE